VVEIASPPVALPVYQQNTQAAKTTPVATSKLRTIKASFMIRLRWEAKFKLSRSYLPATTRGHDDRVSLPPQQDPAVTALQQRLPVLFNQWTCNQES
jgi:hypothetical protein